MESCAAIFARNGNPWNGAKREVPYSVLPFSERAQRIEEILKAHGLTPRRWAAEIRELAKGSSDLEPDLIFARLADEKPEPKSIIRGTSKFIADDQRRMMNIRRKMQQQLNISERKRKGLGNG